MWRLSRSYVECGGIQVGLADAEETSRTSPLYETGEFMKSKAIFLVSCCAIVASLVVGVAASTGDPTEAKGTTLTGKISCSKCVGIQPMHKGYTRWTWALHSVGEGDQIVLVVGRDTYELQGEKDQLLKYMEDKVTVKGDLLGRALVVKAINPAPTVR